MGRPLYRMMSEVFLQHQEEFLLEQLKKGHEVLMYVRHVADVLIIFNETKDGESHDIRKIFNDDHKTLTFISDLEKEGEINFLNLTLIRIKD